MDTRELDREGPSFTLDTLADMRREIGPQRPLVLLLGADAFAGLPTWHRWRDLFGLAHLVVLTRPGHTPPLSDELRDFIASRETADLRALQDQASGKILHLAVTPLEISASQIRALLREGRDPRWLLPDALLDRSGVTGAYR